MKKMMVLMICVLGFSFCVHAQTKPNFMIYLSDDHSMLDCSTYGATDIPTPNMDQLAKDGLKFRRAFIASPACAPSRAAMLTSLMPVVNGAQENHSYPRGEIKKLPVYLKEFGYETAAFGKVAHGGYAKKCGFDFISSKKDVGQLRSTVSEYLNKRKSKKPLCIFVGTSNPHVGWPEVTDFNDDDLVLPPTHIDTPQTRYQRARYYQEIKELDGLLGDLRVLTQKYLGDNTLFMYTSDHGGQWPFSKWTLYDSGIRTPMIAAWPGQIKAGTETSAMVSWIDLLPTLVDLAEGKVTEDIDGLSFAKVLLGEAETHRFVIFTTHSGDKSKNVYPCRAIRTDQYKFISNLHPEFAFTTHTDLIMSRLCCDYWMSWVDRAKTDSNAKFLLDRYYERPRYELYDITVDPYELNNLAADPNYAEVFTDLKGQLETWMKENNDKGEIFNKPRLLKDPDSWKPGQLADPRVKK